MPEVVVGCPVRDRAWILPRYLERLANLELAGSTIRYLFLENLSEDETPQILADFCNNADPRVAIVLVASKEGMPHGIGWQRHKMREKLLIPAFEDMAYLRNQWLEQARYAFPDMTHALLIDSDILVEPDLLERLLAHKVDVVSAVVDNTNGMGNAHNVMMLEVGGGFNWVDRPALDNANGLVRVDLAGACTLLSKRVVDLEEPYKANKQGEDAGFALRMMDEGIAVYCDTTLRPRHIMKEAQLGEE